MPAMIMTTAVRLRSKLKFRDRLAAAATRGISAQCDKLSIFGSHVYAEQMSFSNNSSGVLSDT